MYHNISYHIILCVERMGGEGEEEGEDFSLRGKTHII